MTSNGTSSAKVWLVCNAASGSNNDAAVEELLAAFEAAGLGSDRVLRFPDDPAPQPADLDAAGVDMLAVFGGDGTTHSVVMEAYGWGGAVLVLPGGTMNLLAKRMHGDVPAPEIVARLSGAALSTVRPPVIVSRHGIGLTGALAGPGTVWNEVREAMRAMNVIDFVASTREAIAQSANGPKVMCAEVGSTEVDGDERKAMPRSRLFPRTTACERTAIMPSRWGTTPGKASPCSTVTFATARTTNWAVTPGCGWSAPRASRWAC
ncbi:diacylglycerol kinase family protein [Novosphingobium resinovorum]